MARRIHGRAESTAGFSSHAVLLCVLLLASALLPPPCTAAALTGGAPALNEQQRPPSQSIEIGSGWRLVRTNIGPSDAIVSVQHAVDGMHSDPNLAGMMMLCSPPHFDVLVILIKPYPPDTRPRVRIGGSQALEAKPVAAGVALKLPASATALAEGPWRTQSQLSVEITFNDQVVRGTIPSEGLSNALTALLAHCQQANPSIR